MIRDRWPQETPDGLADLCQASGKAVPNSRGRCDPDGTCSELLDGVIIIRPVRIQELVLDS